MSMSVPRRFEDAPAPEEAAEAIRSMRIRGAAKIGRTAAAALAKTAGETPLEALRDRLRSAGEGLVAARPTAVSLRNGVNLTLDGLREDDETLQEAVIGRAMRYVGDSEAARGRIATLFAAEVPKGATLLTHCHSSLAVACLVAAHKRHDGDVRVFADETRPWFQGHITVRMLAEAGLDVTLIADSAAHHIMDHEDVDVVVVGADTVTADGALYNKIGTRAVALGAQSLDIPFYCAAETHKLSPYSLDGVFPEVEERDPREVLAEPVTGVNVRNPVFDRTPPALIKRYITERGLLEPARVGPFIQDHFGPREGWI